MSLTITDAICTTLELDKNYLHDTLQRDNTNLKTLSLLTKYNTRYRYVTPMHHFSIKQRLKSR